MFLTSIRMTRVCFLGLMLASASLFAATGETFPEWLVRNQVPANKRGQGDDPAGDGVSNVMKYALGLNPLAVATNLVPQAQVTQVQGVDRLVLTVNKNANALGVVYTVEGSSDLSSWSSTGMIRVSETGTQLVVADGVPLSQTNRRYLRLRVSLTDPLSGVLTWETVAAIRGILDKSMATYEIPGILYSVKTQGREAWTDGRGVKDKNAATPIDSEDRFRIGSASKTFVGMAALRLIHQGRLGFEHPISAYLPAKVLSNYKKDQITIRMLLQHTSGINNYTSIIEAWFFPYIYDRKKVWTNEQLVELVNAQYQKAPEEGGKLFDPGLKWEYSNTNTVLLAMIVEKITGIDIRQYITETFIQPLGLKDTIYPAPGESEIPGKHTRGYVDWVNFLGEPSMPAGLTDVTVYDPSGVGPAGPMISTVRDLSVWVEAMVQDDQLIGDLRAGHVDWRYFVALSKSTALTPRPGGYGMKIAHEPDMTNNADYNIVGHRGQISGYDTAMMYLPEKRTSVVVVCNRTLKFAPGFPTNALGVALNQIVAQLYPDLIAKYKIPQAVAEKERASMAEAPVAGKRAWPVPLKEY